jgi:osmotically-inducible protein OsmY
MKKLILKTILLITTGLLLNNCAAILAGGATSVAVAKDPRGFSGVIDDQQLEHKINKVLAKEFESGSYTIASFNGNVLIAGQVPNQAYKDKINLAVKSISGVKTR